MTTSDSRLSFIRRFRSDIDFGFDFISARNSYYDDVLTVLHECENIDSILSFLKFRFPLVHEKLMDFNQELEDTFRFDFFDSNASQNYPRLVILKLEKLFLKSYYLFGNSDSLFYPLSKIFCLDDGIESSEPFICNSKIRIHDFNSIGIRKENCLYDDEHDSCVACPTFLALFYHCFDKTCSKCPFFLDNEQFSGSSVKAIVNCAEGFSPCFLCIARLSHSQNDCNSADRVNRDMCNSCTFIVKVCGTDPVKEGVTFVENSKFTNLTQGLMSLVDK